MNINPFLRVLSALILIGSIFSYITPVSANSIETLRWHPPKDGVIRDAATAISVARLVWFSTNPNLRPESSDESWQSDMIAVRESGVWKVTQKTLPDGSIGGGLEIDISVWDGRVVGIYLTQ